MIQDFFALFVQATQWLQARPEYQAGYKEATRWLKRGATPDSLRNDCHWNKRHHEYRVGVADAIYSFNLLKKVTPVMKNTDETVERLKTLFKNRSAKFHVGNCKMCGEAEGYKLQKGELWFVKGCDCTGTDEPQHRQWWQLAKYIDEMSPDVADACIDKAYKTSTDELSQDCVSKIVSIKPDYLANKPAPTESFGETVEKVYALKVYAFKPHDYRLARKLNGDLVLQGYFPWSQGSVGGGDWKDLPTVNLEE